MKSMDVNSIETKEYFIEEESKELKENSKEQTITKEDIII